MTTSAYICTNADTTVWNNREIATSLKIDDAMKARVQHLAAARDRSAHWVMREAIREYVEREEKRDALRQDAMRAWQNYQETGLHLTGDEMEAWLRSWGKPDEIERPPSHN